MKRGSDFQRKTEFNPAPMNVNLIEAISCVYKKHPRMRTAPLRQQRIVNVPAIGLRFRTTGTGTGSRDTFFFGDDVPHSVSKHLPSLARIAALDPDSQRSAAVLQRHALGAGLDSSFISLVEDIFVGVQVQHESLVGRFPIMHDVGNVMAGNVGRSVGPFESGIGRAEILSGSDGLAEAERLPDYDLQIVALHRVPRRNA